ncbi:MAG: DivIVA domain-containing protein [Actinobacteria bacterium]|nr:DivIVA domain-containing protein [Actinomycetota bacterium]
MAISPMDIHLKEFSVVSTGGYDRQEVDSFLDSVADELERLESRNKELEDLIARMHQKVSQFDEMQKMLQTALTNAQKSAGNILQEARSQAAAIIKRAQERSERIVKEMERERERIISSVASVREQIMEQIPRMRELLEKSRQLLGEYEECTLKADISSESKAVSEEPETVEEGEVQAASEQAEVAKEEAAPVEEEAGAAASAETPGEDKEKYIWD